MSTLWGGQDKFCESVALLPRGKGNDPVKKKDAFVGTIGYDGQRAVVDRARVLKHSRSSLQELLSAGAFREAAACAVWERSTEALEAVASAYNARSGSRYSAQDIAKVFGIASEPGEKAVIL